MLTEFQNEISDEEEKPEAPESATKSPEDKSDQIENELLPSVDCEPAKAAVAELAAPDTAVAELAVAPVAPPEIEEAKSAPLVAPPKIYRKPSLFSDDFEVVPLYLPKLLCFAQIKLPVKSAAKDDQFAQNAAAVKIQSQYRGTLFVLIFVTAMFHVYTCILSNSAHCLNFFNLRSSLYYI